MAADKQPHPTSHFSILKYKLNLAFECSNVGPAVTNLFVQHFLVPASSDTAKLRQRHVIWFRSKPALTYLFYMYFPPLP